MEYRLPVGTIVTINDIKYPIVLIGHELAINNQKRYNYTGVLHPVGFSPDVDMVFFNHEDVEDIIQLGLSDFDHTAFSDMLDLEFGKNIYKDVEKDEEVLSQDILNDEEYIKL